MIDLYNDLLIAYERGQDDLIRLKNDGYEFDKIVSHLYQSFEASAWYNCLIKKDIESAKQDFYNCGLADIEDSKIGKDIFGYKRDSPLNASLSDSKELIDSFATIEYKLRSGPQKGKTNKDLAKIGKSHIYIDTIIKSMTRDYDGLMSNLIVMETVFLRMKKNAVFTNDYDFFSGILKQDKDKVFNSINILSTKEHKKRNKDSYYKKDLISQPALGFAKIAWINEMELEFDNDLIPNELLAIKPLDRYQDKIYEYKDIMDKTK